MATKEIKIINHLGKGFIGPLFLGVTVGVYLDTAIAKIETIGQMENSEPF